MQPTTEICVGYWHVIYKAKPVPCVDGLYKSRGEWTQLDTVLCNVHPLVWMTQKRKEARAKLSQNLGYIWYKLVFYSSIDEDTYHQVKDYMD